MFGVINNNNIFIIVNNRTDNVSSNANNNSNNNTNNNINENRELFGCFNYNPPKNEIKYDLDNKITHYDPKKQQSDEENSSLYKMSFEYILNNN